MGEDRRLAALVERLREAVEARDAFVAVAAHELRNPMFALGLLLDQALGSARREGAEQTVERLELARAALYRYLSRATTILDVSRIVGGRARLDVEDADLAAIVRRVADAHGPEAALNEAPIALSAPAELRLRCDPLAVEQIVANLLSNAVKYGAGAPVEVALTREGDGACLVVRDRGPGIAEKDRARLFERFERVATQASRPGFGIGLWLARRLVEAHGGAIEIESEPGRGSRFTVRLPPEPTDPSSPASPPESP
jgi:signal transduction histidine kinase